MIMSMEPTISEKFKKTTQIHHMETIPEKVEHSSGADISEDDAQPGGPWEQYLRRQLRVGGKSPSLPWLPSKDSANDTFNFNFNSQEESVIPFKRSNPKTSGPRLKSKASSRQLKISSSSQDGSPSASTTVQDLVAFKSHGHQQVINAVFDNFPDCLTQGNVKRLTDIGDREYGLMAISNNSSWTHLGHRDMPHRVKKWISTFVCE